MTGTFLTNQLPSLAILTGSERAPFDTNAAGGAFPQQVEITLAKLALLLICLQNGLSKTMVAGTRYYSQFNIGDTLANAPSLVAVSQANGYLITGVNVAVGATGGTDLWNAELHDSAGVTLATSLLTGTTAGTANTIQQLAFTAPVTVNSGTFFIVLQSNGTTATFKSINSPIWPFITGSATGTLGTAANFTPATTYTANLGPQVSLY